MINIFLSVYSIIVMIFFFSYMMRMKLTASQRVYNGILLRPVIYILFIAFWLLIQR